MLTLKLDEIPAEGLALEWKEEPATLSGYLENLSDIDFRFESPLQSQAKIKRVGQSVLIKGRVQATLQLRCVRCLKDFPYPLASTFELTLHPLKGMDFKEETELSANDLESNFFEGGEIHLSEIACEQIFLEIPIQPLCQDACKGLCSHCGIDLNLSTCDCMEEKVGIGFDVLEKMKIKRS
jgi:uncharacterized protein